ncbi:MAG: Na+/H+ antiporter NhaC [Longimicrobiales bacterium]
MQDETKPTPTLGMSLIPVVVLIASLSYTIIVLDGSGHIPLILGTVVAVAIAAGGLGMSWPEIQDGMVKGISAALPAILILIIVGLLIGVWIASGVVPVMIFYGLKILAPGYFLVATIAICALISLATGSSWSTAATVGVAMMGVGQALQIPPGMTAGAVVSGAYFGDKMSPLSDTTNLAPAVAGTDLFTHIRHMVFTTVPALIVAIILFTVIGIIRPASGSVETSEYVLMVSTLSSSFNLSPWLLIAPACVLFLVWKKTPALPSLVIGVIVGAVLLLVFQQDTGPEGASSIGRLLDSLYSGYVSESGVASVDELLSRGGLGSMMDTIALIMVALSFGGIMEASGMLERLAAFILKLARSAGSLIAVTIFSCFGMNILASDQYLAIIVPGRMYRGAYLKRGLHPKNLSRALEDSATLTSPLIPWNTCGAYMSTVLGVSSFVYLPFAFLNLASPMISIFYGFTGITIQKIEDDPDSLVGVTEEELTAREA